MFKLDHDYIYKALGHLIDKIEQLGASEELTEVVSLAIDLRLAVGNQWNPANIHALFRLQEKVRGLTTIKFQEIDS